jgi:hypothetical protein
MLWPSRHHSGPRDGGLTLVACRWQLLFGKGWSAGMPTISIATTAETAVIEVSGAFDIMSSHLLADALAVAGNASVALVSFHECSYLDTTSLSVLVGADRGYAFTHSGGRRRLSSPTTATVTGMMRRFRQHSSSRP